MIYYTISLISEHNLAAAAELQKKCFNEPWSLQSIAEAVAIGGKINDEYTIPGIGFFEAVTENNIHLGHIGFQLFHKEGYIPTIAVDQNYRRMGIATALLKKVIETAKIIEFEQLVLEVRESNDAAIKLYESLGFENIGIRKNFYKLPPENGVVMRLLI